MNGGARGPVAPHLVADDFLSATESAGLRQWALDNRDRFLPAKVDHGVRPEARNALSLRDLGPLAELIRARALTNLVDWIGRLKVTAFAPSLVELELVAHNDGAHFTIHSDTYSSSTPAFGDRMLSAVYYFHDEPKRFSGGVLRLHRLGARSGDEGLDVSPDNGRLIVFPSWWPHEVLRVSCATRAFEDSRLSLNCWIHRARGP